MGYEFNACFLVSKEKSPAPLGRKEDFPVLLGCNVLRKLSAGLSKLKLCKLSPDWDLALRWFLSVNSDCH